MNIFNTSKLYTYCMNVKNVKQFKELNTGYSLVCYLLMVTFLMPAYHHHHTLLPRTSDWRPLTFILLLSSLAYWKYLFLTASQPWITCDSSSWFYNKILISAPIREEYFSEYGPRASESHGCSSEMHMSRYPQSCSVSLWGSTSKLSYTQFPSWFFRSVQCETLCAVGLREQNMHHLPWHAPQTWVRGYLQSRHRENLARSLGVLFVFFFFFQCLVRKECL